MSWYVVLVAIMGLALVSTAIHPHATAHPHRVQLCAYATAANVNGHRVITQHIYKCN